MSYVSMGRLHRSHVSPLPWPAQVRTAEGYPESGRSVAVVPRVVYFARVFMAHIPCRRPLASSASRRGARRMTRRSKGSTQAFRPRIDARPLLREYPPNRDLFNREPTCIVPASIHRRLTRAATTLAPSGGRVARVDLLKLRRMGCGRKRSRRGNLISSGDDPSVVIRALLALTVGFYSSF
jgi:hypothetical protein